MTRLTHLLPQLLDKTTNNWRPATFSLLHGTFFLHLVGVVNNLTVPLKAAMIGVFVVSTWNTDYLLTPLAKHEGVEVALKATAGCLSEFVTPHQGHEQRLSRWGTGHC
ncbi:hypothetical protein DL93DRAFT_2068905 [Clavulina sp. PMI_390]|nr:hypothetical protein DL93DRAFT_2068905 [Clavulina sp. PMI_390]